MDESVVSVGHRDSRVVLEKLVPVFSYSNGITGVVRAVWIVIEPTGLVLSL